MRSLIIHWKVLLQGVALAVAGLWIYWPALHGDWLWDDDLLVTGNPALRSLHGLLQIWFAKPSTDYWPLSWTFLWMEWHLWGNNPFGYHLCSLVLHVFCGFLIWRIFGRLGLRWGWLGGFLFVIHPLAVESVAWVAEIKNTLSLPFFLLSFDAWLDAEEKKPTGYQRSVLCYLAAMLAKTSTVMLPACLLLYCWWKRGSVSLNEIKRTIPYGCIALVLGLVTIHFQDSGHRIIQMEPGDLITRSTRAGAAFFFYLEKFVLPIDLLPVYPRWILDRPFILRMLALPALAVLFLGLWTQRKGWGRHALFGFGFFLLNALPVLGFLEMRYMDYSWVADHLIYLPMIGLVGLVVAGLERLSRRVPSFLHVVGGVTLALVLALLALGSHRYASLFINMESLCTYALPYNPEAPMLHDNLGVYLLRQHRLPEAIEQFNEALRILPTYAAGHANLGLALQESGQVPEAIDQYEEAVKFEPAFGDAPFYFKWGVALVQAGRASEAVEPLKEALKIDPRSAPAENALGVALIQTGHAPEAIEHFEQALKIRPDYVDARNNLTRARAN